MGKKQVKNRYGVQTGDIFNWHSLHEDFGGYSFYQVVALRGETQVAVREINQKVIAFDGHCHKGVAPLPDDWHCFRTDSFPCQYFAYSAYD